MERYGKWETSGKPLGEGGQGRVYLARDTQLFNQDSIVNSIIDAVRVLASIKLRSEMIESANTLAKKILEYARETDPKYCGAVKVLHPAESNEEYGKQLQRMKREVEALKTVSHPNIARVLDANLAERWFVMEYFPDGTLAIQPPRFAGQLFPALLAFRPLVEGVAEMHRRNLIHRDIKPENIFVSSSRGLVLADFGLIFLKDDDKTRLSETYENIGSRDWMPGWAFGMRIEDVRPTFDVFALGKLLWSLLSGKRKLRLWYHHRDEFELEKLFPDNPEIRWARVLLDKCIVEHEKDCLQNAEELLVEIDRVLRALRTKGQVISENIPRLCQVCGLGEYQDVTGREFTGLTSPGGFKLFLCSHCGHAEFFSQRKFPAWDRSDRQS